MANTQSFPILRLPNLAREHIIMVMDVREQYLFSALSKKSKRIAKNGIRLISYVFRFMLSEDDTFIDIKKNWSSQWFRIMILPIGEHYQISDAYVAVQMNVEDVFETTIEQLELLNEQFKISNILLDFYIIQNEDTKRFLDVVRDLKISVYQLYVSGDDVDTNNKMYTWAMNNCQDVKRLINCCHTTEDFEWNSQNPFASEYCYLRWAHWLKLDHLTRIFINCRFFQSKYPNIRTTEVELNRFVKTWIEGSKLEFVKIRLQNQYSIRSVLRDIQKEPVQEAFIENRLRRFKAGKAFKIQQKSGNEAVVFIRNVNRFGSCKFYLTTHFNDRKCDFWDEKEEEKEWESEEDENEEEEDFEDVEEEGEEENEENQF